MSQLVLVDLVELKQIIKECVLSAMGAVQTSNHVEEQEILTIGEVSKLLGLSKGTLYKMVQSRQIPFNKPNNGKLLFRRSELISWVSSGRKPTRLEIAKAVAKQLSER